MLYRCIQDFSSSLKVVTKEYKIFHWATMKLVSGKCLWKPRKLRRLRFFTKTIQLPWLWATGRAYIDRFLCLILGTRAPCQCWVWPCGCVVPSSTDIVQSDIVSPMKWDMTTYHLPSPLPGGHTTPHSSARDTVGDPDKFRECNVGLLPILISHSYPLTLTWIDSFSKKSPCSVSGAPTSLPGHPTPRLPCGKKGTHQFHCF